MAIQFDDCVDVLFSDSDSIPAFAKVAVQYLSSSGVINGKDDNRFDPDTSATRAEAAALFSRMNKIVTVQDFSMLNNLGVSIKANAEIDDGSAFGGFKSYDFSVILSSDKNIYKSDDFIISVCLTGSAGSSCLDLTGESINGQNYYSVDNKYALSTLGFIEGERIWAEITVKYHEESAAYHLFPTVRTFW